MANKETKLKTPTNTLKRDSILDKRRKAVQIENDNSIKTITESKVFKEFQN